jgi:diguanylate cyclase (GGDEF)-like protein
MTLRSEYGSENNMMQSQKLLQSFISQLHVTLILGEEGISADEAHLVFKKHGCEHVHIYPVSKLNQAKPNAGDPFSHVYGYVGEPKHLSDFLKFSGHLFEKDDRPYFFTVSSESLPAEEIIGTFSGHMLGVIGDRSKHFEMAWVQSAHQAILASGIDFWHEQWADLKKNSDEANAEAYQFQQEQNEIIRFTKVLGEKLDATDVAKSACQFMSDLFKASGVAFAAYEPLTDTLRLSYSQGEGNYKPLQKGIEVGMRGKRNQTTHFETFCQTDTLRKSIQLNASEIKVHIHPTYLKNEVLGVFVLLIHEKSEAYQPHFLSQLIHYYTVSYQNATLHGEITNLATRDGLTKLHNVRYFHERIAAEFNRMERLKQPIGLIFMDIDNFKNYNDTHGHPMGDKVIQKTAELIKKFFRPSDIIARYGGEEFVVALPHANLEDSLSRAKDLCDLIAKTAYPKEETQPLGRVSISIGVSAFPEVANDVKTLLQSADEALYEVKEGGRNNVKAAKAPAGHVALFEPRQES